MTSHRNCFAGSLTLVCMTIVAGCGSTGPSPFSNNMASSVPAPMVVSVGMQVNGVAPNRIQDVQFSENMDASTINNQTFVIRDGGGKAVSGIVTYNPAFQIASFKPNPALHTSSNYTGTITTAVASVQGKHLAANYTFQFTTRSYTDQSPIYVASVTPAPNTTGVSAMTPITIRFSEGVDPATINATNIVITGPTGAMLPAQINYNASTSIVTLTPTMPLPSGKITVTVRNVADLADVAMTSTYAWSFDTATASGSSTQKEFLYSTAFEEVGKLYAYQINTATGSLTPVSGEPFNANVGSSAYCTNGCGIALAGDPLGRYLYYSYQEQNGTGLGSLMVNSATGALTNISNLSQPEGGVGISIDPSGRFIYGAEDGLGPSPTPPSELYGYKVGSGGTLSTVPGEPYTLSGTTTMSPPAVSSNYVYALDASNNLIDIFHIDSSDGALTSISNPVPGYQPPAVTPSGRYVYVADLAGNNTLEIMPYQVNAGGSLTMLKALAQPTPETYQLSGLNIVISPNGQFLYAVGSKAAYVYTINQNTGALALTSTYSSLSRATLAIDPMSKYLYAATTSGPPNYYANSTIMVFNINPITGALTPMPGSTITLPNIPQGLGVVLTQ